MRFLCNRSRIWLALVFLIPAVVSAQESETAPDLVELTTVKAKQSGDGWQIDFSGKAPKVPAGTVVKIALWWKFQELMSYEITIDGSQRFRESKMFKDLNGFAKAVFLRSEIDFLDQTREIQALMEKDSETWPMAKNPWSWRYYDQRFNLGTDAQLAEQARRARQFFLDAVKEALSADQKVTRQRKAVEGGTAFQKNGTFDSAAWQKWLEAEVRDPIRELQERMRTEKHRLWLLPHGRDFTYLSEVVNAVARRSFERSRDLYQKLGMSADSADLAPKNININCKRSNSKYLNQRVKQLCQSQEIDLSELR